MRKTYVVSAKRSAIGSFLGSLTTVKPVDLGATVVKALLEDGKVAPEQVDELLCGNVLSAGLGQNIGRQVALAAGIPESVCSHSVNMVCGSGLRTVMEGVMSIQTGFNDIVVAGGVESMSGAPYLIPANTRTGNKMGDFKCVDHMIYDALTDAMNGIHMGVTAENIAKKYNITREMQDAFGYASQQKAIAAVDSGRFKDEIVPVTIKTKKGETVFDTDEFPREGTTTEILAKLRPAFKQGGTVTAGNASGLNDGAAALVIMSAEKAQELGIKPMAKILSYASAGVDPAIMGIGPIPASRKALSKAGLEVKDLDLIEANEAFAAQFVEVGRELNFDPDKVNVNGGAIALGHPIGASGARILVTLLYALKNRDKKLGLATLCIGGGMGTSAVVEML